MRALPLFLLTAAALLGASATAQANEETLNKAGCMACHSKDKKLVGPSLKEVAAKYKGQDATAALVQKVRSGGKGVYGPIPMPPNPPEKINEADLKGGVEWILKQ